MQKPGKTNLPVDLTSFVAVAARLEIIWPATFCLSSNSSAMVLAMALLVMTLLAPAFIDFIGAMLQNEL